MPFTLTVTGLEHVAERLQSAAAQLPSALVPATDAIAAALQADITARYGPVAKYFTITTNTTGTASVVATATDKKVGWYEWGTRAHAILAVRARALRFELDGATVFAPRVQHPGTQAHNEIPNVLATLETVARATWSQAIASLLQGD